eukprot:365130-Chlamydomonas_euryale.AAC.7
MCKGPWLRAGTPSAFRHCLHTPKGAGAVMRWVKKSNEPSTDPSIDAGPLDRSGSRCDTLCCCDGLLPHSCLTPDCLLLPAGDNNPGTISTKAINFLVEASASTYPLCRTDVTTAPNCPVSQVVARSRYANEIVITREVVRIAQVGGAAPTRLQHRGDAALWRRARTRRAAAQQAADHWQ